MATMYVALLALIAAANAVPTRYEPFTCANKCNDQPTKFSYRPSTTYIYDYQVDTETTFAGAAEDSAKFSIQAQAEIEPISQCEFVLNVRNVKVHHSDGYSKELKLSSRSEELRELLGRNSARFSFDDGVISNICPVQDEDLWSVNFKRGLLSAFQNSMTDFKNKNQRVQEIDISGDCEATYNMSESWGWTREMNIKKSKDLLACTQRASYDTVLQAVPYNVPSEIQSAPIMKQSHSCESTLDPESKIMRSTMCKESYVFIPFSNRQSGGSTTVSQKLTYKSQTRGQPSETNHKTMSQRSLLFEHASGPSSKLQGSGVVSQNLNQMCQQTSDDVRPETPRQFSALIDSIKATEHSDLLKVYKQLKTDTLCPGNSKGRDLFLDALPMAGTSGSVRLMVEIIGNKEVDTLRRKAWITSLAFIQQPTEEMMRSVGDLLTGYTSEEAKLPVAALVNMYCRSGELCESNAHVNEIVSKLAYSINRYCSVDDGSLGKVLLSLRALGNLGVTSEVSKVLNKCLKSDYAPLEVRVAAADAYRRVPCAARQIDGLWDTLKDDKLDSELRITSYLALMRCPKWNTLSRLASFQEKVEDQQVGTFIYSHLKNIGQTSDPHKLELAKYVNKLSLKEFDIGVMDFKFSRNMEVSALINKLNLGAVIDSDLLMDSKSSLPRSANLNFTMELFGNSVNLFELGGRVEGLEYLIERAMMFLRPESQKQQSSKLEEIRASMYARVFGNEISFNHVKGPASSLLQPMGLPNIQDLFKNLAKQQKFSYTHSRQLIDASIIYPTAAGIPLNLTVNGSAVVNIQAEGKVDLTKTFLKVRSTEIAGEIRPSGSIEISGSMMSDIVVCTIGNRMRNILHSSTAVKARLDINRSRQLNIEIDAPKDKMEILQASSSFYITHHGVEKEQEMIRDNYQTLQLCTGKLAAKITGYEMCSEVKFPNASQVPDAPYFPLSGPTSFSIYLNKKDSLRKFKLFAKWSESKRSTEVQFLMNTPGSKVNRLISTDLAVGYSPDKRVDLIVNSPWGKVNFNSGLVINKALKSLTGSLQLNDKDKYGVTAEVKTSKKENGNMVYIPLVEVTHRSVPTTLVSGQATIRTYRLADFNFDIRGSKGVSYTLKGKLVNLDEEKRARLSVSDNENREYMFHVGSTIASDGGTSFDMRPELELKTPTKDLVSIKGFINHKYGQTSKGDWTVKVHKMRPATLTYKFKETPWTSGSSKTSRYTYDLDMKVRSALVSGSVESNVQLKNNQLMSKVKTQYNIPRLGGKNTVIWSYKFTSVNQKLTIKSTMNNKGFPDYNFGVLVDVAQKKKHSEAAMEIQYGANMKDKQKVVAVVASLDSRTKSALRAYTVKLVAKAPEKNVNMAVETTFLRSPFEMASNLNMKLQPLLKNPIDFSIQLKNKGRKQKLNNYMANATLEVMGKTYSAKTDLVQKSAKQYLHVLNLQDSDGKVHSIVTLYKMQKGYNFDVRSDVTIVGREPLQLIGKLDIDSNKAQVIGSLADGGHVYSIESKSKVDLSERKQGKVTVNVKYPGRELEYEASASKVQGILSGKSSFDWDAGKQNGGNSLISLDGSVKVSGLYYSEGRRNYPDQPSQISADLSFESPFENFEYISSNIKFIEDKTQYNINGRVAWRQKQNKISSNLVLKKPLDLSNIQIQFDTLTPFKKYQKLGFEISHKMDTSIFTSLMGKLGRENAELTLKGTGSGGMQRGDITGKINIKTPVANMRDFSLTLSHTHDLARGKFSSSGQMVHNGAKYDANVDLEQKRQSSNLKHNGRFSMNWPQDNIVASWKHQSSGISDIKSSVEADWSGNKHFELALTGSNKEIQKIRIVKGEIQVKTPWENYQELSTKLNHVYGKNQIKSKLSASSNMKEKLNIGVQLGEIQHGRKAEIKVLTPLYKDQITAKGTVVYSQYPVSVSASVGWTPFRNIDFEGSVNAPSLDNMQLDVKLTTPFKQFENIIIKGSNILDNGERIAHANIDFGVKKMIDFEGKLRNHPSAKGVRVKLFTPFEMMKKLDTGFEVEVKQSSMSGQVDFEMRPLVNKYDGLVDFSYERQDVNGKVRVRTPYKSMRYLQLSGWSKARDVNSRAIHIELDHSSEGMYSFDISYQVEKRYTFNVNVKTPHPEYDNVGALVVYIPSNRGLKSKVRLTYQSGKEINTQLKLRWGKIIDGSLSIKTPFVNYETSTFILKHNGDIYDFTTHAEGHLGGNSVVGDVSFSNNEQMTSGSMKLESPIKGLENIDCNLRLRGHLSDLSGEALLKIGSHVTKTVILNKYSPKLMKSSLTLVTPYTEEMKFSVNYIGGSDDFLNNLKNSLTFETKLNTQYVNISMNYLGKIDLDNSLNRHNASVYGSYGGKVISSKVGFEMISDDNKEGVKNIMFDADLSTPYTENMKLSLNYEPKIDGNAKKFQSSIYGRYGDKVVNNNISVEFGDLKDIQLKIDLSTPYTEDIKFSLKYEPDSDSYTRKFHSNLYGSYGDKAINSDVFMAFGGLKDVQLGIDLNAPFKVIRKVKFNVDHQMNSKKVFGKIELNTNLKDLRNFKLSYSKVGPINDMVFKAVAIRNSRTIFNIVLNTKHSKLELHDHLVLTSDLFQTYEVELQHTGSLLNFESKVKLSLGDGDVVNTGLSFKFDKPVLGMTFHIRYPYSEKFQVYELRVHKDGSPEGFSLKIVNTLNGREVSALVDFQNAEKSKGLVSISGLRSPNDVMSINLELSGDLEKFLSTGKVRLNEKQEIAGKLNFYRVKMQRVQATAELRTPFAGYEDTQFEYRHEGTDARLSCSMSTKYGADQTLGADLILNRLPSHSLSLHLKTPVHGYNDMSLSGNFDKSSINGRLSVTEDWVISFDSVLDSSKYPYHPMYRLKTPFQCLKQIEVNMKGQVLDGSVSVIIIGPKDAKFEGHATLDYQNMLRMNTDVTLSSSPKQFEPITFSLKNSETDGKTSAIMISQGDKKVSVDGRYVYTTGWTSQTTRQASVNIKVTSKTPLSYSVNLEHNTDTSSQRSSVKFNSNGNMLVDMDMEMELSREDKKSLSITVREPWPMDYSVSVSDEPTKSELEIKLDWNSNSPGSKMEVKSMISDASTQYNTEKKHMLTVILPSRTIGIAHSISGSSGMLTSEGKLHLDKSTENTISYLVDVKDSSSRGKRIYDGVFKLGLPSRTLGLSGSLSNNAGINKAEGSFSWGMDGDTSKQIAITASTSGVDHTKADISVKLPSDVQVDSEVTINQGSTIFDGKTDISYSHDSSKTLTFFSRLQNIQSQQGGIFSGPSNSNSNFNYSVELGMRHPYTKMDVKLDSHLGMSDDSMTSSVGFHYLTSTRQMKNIALWAEIDSLKREINLVTSGLEKTHEIHGKIVKVEPLKVEVNALTDREKTFTSTLDMNSEQGSLQIDAGNGNSFLTFRTFYPNDTTFVADVLQRHGGSQTETVVFSARLMTPHLLHTRLHWNPDVFKNLRPQLTQEINSYKQRIKQALIELAFDVEVELVEKYGLMMVEVVEVIKPVIRFVQDELLTVEKEIAQAIETLEAMEEMDDYYFHLLKTALTDRFNSLLNYLRNMKLYTQTYKSAVQTMSVKLEDIKNYPVGQHISQSLSDTVANVNTHLDGMVVSTVGKLAQLEGDLSQLPGSTRQMLANIRAMYFNNPRIQSLIAKLNEAVDINYRSYISQALESLKDNHNYLNAMSNNIAKISKTALNVVPRDIKKSVEKATNEIYQQAVWAYQFWDVEQAAVNNLEMIMMQVEDVVKAAWKEYLNSLRFFIKNPITVFDPKHGEIQANLRLPIAVHSIREMPEVVELLERMIKAMDIYRNMTQVSQHMPTDVSGEYRE